MILKELPGVPNVEDWYGKRAIGGAGAMLAGIDSEAAGKRVARAVPLTFAAIHH